MPDPNDIVFAAAAFAARAHRHQTRKDGQTPYFSHPVRVCLVVSHVFGFHDPKMLAAALLHDTIEDTTTDCDDIVEHFGEEVARWVTSLSKDPRMPHDEREHAYGRQLAASEWQVKALKLADIYDNLGDCAHSSAVSRRKTAAKAHAYLEFLAPGLPEHVKPALRLVEERLAQISSTQTA
jgi:guanosine-3',5'-bis(diphosphate) 3'-pyrophosphohydrolase